MRVRYLFLTIIIPILIHAGEPSTRCLPLPDVPKAYSEAAAVFLGEVIEKDDFHFKFRVERTWKGECLSEVVLVTGAVEVEGTDWIYNRDSLWRYDFEPGKKYLVYADNTPKGLYGHKCSRTRPEADAEKDMEELDLIVGSIN